MSAALQLVEQPDTTDLAAEGSALVQRASAITIIDDTSFAAAVAFMNDCATRRKTIVAKFAEPKQKAHEAHAAIRALEKELLDVVETAEREAKKRIGEYRLEQERLAEEERRRLEVEARLREEERVLSEALDAENAGDDTLAEEIIAEPIAPPPVRVAAATPKVAGVQFRETWKFQITDPLALVRHIAAHPEDICYINWSTVALQRDVTSRKSAFRKPGVRVYSEQTVAAGGRR